MGFFEQEMLESGDISKDFFRVRAESVLTDLFNVDFGFLELPEARFFSLLYAEAKRGNALLKKDLVQGERKREYWTSEHDRWHKAILQNRGGDLSFLIHELRYEADQYFRRRNESAKMADYHTVLTNLAMILEQEKQT
jgi:hypothetical protein